MKVDKCWDRTQYTPLFLLSELFESQLGNSQNLCIWQNVIKFIALHKPVTEIGFAFFLPQNTEKISMKFVIASFQTRRF
jgi:hypothetical protein